MEEKETDLVDMAVSYPSSIDWEEYKNQDIRVYDIPVELLTPCPKIKDIYGLIDTAYLKPLIKKDKKVRRLLLVNEEVLPNGQIEIIGGRHRWTIAKELLSETGDLRWSTVPCIKERFESEEAKHIAIVSDNQDRVRTYRQIYNEIRLLWDIEKAQTPRGRPKKDVKPDTFLGPVINRVADRLTEKISVIRRVKWVYDHLDQDLIRSGKYKREHLGDYRDIIEDLDNSIITLHKAETLIQGIEDKPEIESERIDFVLQTIGNVRRPSLLDALKSKYLDEEGIPKKSATGSKVYEDIQRDYGLHIDKKELRDIVHKFAGKQKDIYNRDEREEDVEYYAITLYVPSLRLEPLKRYTFVIDQFTDWFEADRFAKSYGGYCDVDAPYQTSERTKKEKDEGLDSKLIWILWLKPSISPPLDEDNVNEIT